MAQTQKSGKGDTTPQKKNPLDDPENVKKLQLTQEFCLTLVRTIKNIGLYRHATGKFMEFVEKPSQQLAAITEQLGAVSFRCETQAFTLFGQDLWGSETGENIPYKFYRDGIRNLIFRPGITAEELLTFVLIAISDTKQGDEDILQQLWAASFQHIEYVVVEGLTIGDMSEEEVQVQVDQIMSYLYQRLRSNSEDYLRFARLSAEDLELKLDQVDQIRGAVIAGETADDELMRRVKEELKEDMELRLFNKLVVVLFQCIESNTISDVAELKDTFVQVLDAMVLREDFATVNQLLTKLKAMERNSSLAGLSNELRTFLTMKMGESQRLETLAQVLRNSRPKSPSDMFRYFMVLSNNVVPALLDILDTVEIPENRTMLCDVLATLGKDSPDPFVARMESERSQTIHDMLYIIDKCDFPDKVKIFGNALKNKNLAVKLEALGVIGRSRTEGARKLLTDALTDIAPQVRLGAARALVTFDREKAVPEILKVIKSPEFDKRELPERTQWYVALGSTISQGALTFLKEVIDRKASLLNRKRVAEDKLMAVAGLGAATSVVSFKILQTMEQEKGLDPELLNAVRRAMFNVKKALFGDPNAAPPPTAKA